MHTNTTAWVVETLLYCISHAISNMTACLCLWPQSMCYWWNPFRHKHSHTLPTKPPKHIHPQHPLSNTSWSSVTNKKSLETDRLLGGSDLLSGVSSLSPCPLTLITFPVSPLDFSLLFLMFHSVSLSCCSSSLFFLSLSLWGWKKEPAVIYSLLMS